MRRPRPLITPYETRTLTAYKDCWVNSNQPDKNFNDRGFAIGRWDYLNRAFVGFDLGGLDINEEDVVQAELRLYGKALYKPLIVEAHYTNSSWGETTITWNNQPPPTTLSGVGTSLMGSTTDVPSAAEGWFSIPLEVAFIKHRWGRKLWAILKGYEGASNSYCYTYDRELGAYAPQLILSTEVAGGISTKISISVPSNVSSGESFEVFGVLQRADTNATLNGETIQLWIDGVHVASTVTTIIGTPMGPQDGAYLFTRSISSDGEHMLEVKFLGSTSSGLMLGASNAVLNLGNRLRDLIQSIF